MIAFSDPYTGAVYQMDAGWLRSVREHLAGKLSALIEDTEQPATAVAGFWTEDYYAELFPLRFGVRADDQTTYSADFLFPDTEDVDLVASVTQPFRERFLDGDKLPPLMTAGNGKSEHELIADRLLTETAIAHLILRQDGVPAPLIDDVRLAFLTYPFLDLLSDVLKKRCAQAFQVAGFLAGKHNKLPSGLDPTLLAAIRDGGDLPEQHVWLVLVAVQRIKRYVFETPGLNEIRGASTLLDELTAAARDAVAAELGPEVILRAVGSTLLFLAPAETDAEAWVEHIRRGFYRATGVAFTTAASTKVPVESLWRGFSGSLAQAYAALESDRARGQAVFFAALPFESRCSLCRTRPAEGWEDLPGEAEPSPICRVCQTKRAVGQPGRAARPQQMLEEWLKISDPAELGIAGKGPKEYVARSLGGGSEDEPGLIPAGVRRTLLATIYGDGNNFGLVGQHLASMGLARQWYQRVEKVTRAAASIALARATQEAARDRGWTPSSPKGILPKLPFQVLALGGDDLSLFAWAPVGVRFCSNFLMALNEEFRVGSGSRIVQQPIAFSVGAVLVDARAAVRKTIVFAEDEMLKWAKQAFRDSSLHQGNVAFLLANTQEQIPDDLERYRSQVYRREGHTTLYLTVRPFLAAELAWLLEEAHRLRPYSGPLHRLVSVFVQSSPLEALLHYVYQRGRASSDPNHWLERFESGGGPPPASLQKLRYPAVVCATLGGRKPFGLDSATTAGTVLFTTLWDLLELIKILE